MADLPPIGSSVVMTHDPNEEYTLGQQERPTSNLRWFKRLDGCTVLQQAVERITFKVKNGKRSDTQEIKWVDIPEVVEE